MEGNLNIDRNQKILIGIFGITLALNLIRFMYDIHRNNRNCVCKR